MADRAGLEVRNREKFNGFAPGRRIEEDGDVLVIHGVPAGRMILDQPSLVGKPEQDEAQFHAIQWVSQTSVGIPLRSWVIQDAMLWLATGDPDESANLARLAWAKDDCLHILQRRYPIALAQEQAQFTRAACLELPQAEADALRNKVATCDFSGLMKHQWVGVQAICDRKEVLLCDEQGLGKTVEILVGLEVTQAFPAVVLAPATALLNWRDEAARWLPHRRVAVLGAGVSKRDAGVDPAGADLILLNYESFAKHAAGVLSTLQLGAIVADEAQYLKGHDSQRTKSVKDFLRHHAPTARVICATGTPVMNRPSELLTLLTLMPGTLAALGGFGRFASRYCRATLFSTGGFMSQKVWDYGGAANLEEIARRLRECGSFVRRSKAQVLPDLAPKLRSVVAVEISNRTEYRQVCEGTGEWLKAHNKPNPRKAARRQHFSAGRESDDAELSALEALADWYGWGADEIDSMSFDDGGRADALRQMGVLRQLAGVGKIPAALRWITERVKDEKLVVFAFHREVQDALAAALQEYKPLTITGDMTVGARRTAIQQFQTDPAARLIVCSLKAAQTAITLTSARSALMVELDWTPSALEQAEDRIHRISQTCQVEITYLHASDTLDDRMVELIDAKRKKISVLNAVAAPAVAAPHGFRKDGQPRKRPAGPGRKALPADERLQRQRASKAGWQARNAVYMRDYMRERRRKA